MTKNIILIFCVLFSINTYASRSYNFTHIDGKNGLSASNVKAILKDSYGFMWFGTKNGLNRYDGNTVLQLNCDDHIAGKKNHNIGALYEDKDQILWVGTDRGVYKYNPITDIFTFIDTKSSEGISPDNWVNDIKEDKDGNIWVLIPTQGVFRFKDDIMEFYTVAPKTNFKTVIDCMSISPDGELWLGSSGIGLFRYDSSSNRFEQRLTDNNGYDLRGLLISNIGFIGDHLILAMYNSKLLEYDPQANHIIELPSYIQGKSYLYDMICYDDQIWIGTHQGLYVINYTTGHVDYLQEDLMRSFSLSDNFIYCIYRDNEGGIWIGTKFGGVNYLPQYQMNFQTYVPGSNPNSLSGKRVHGLLEDYSGNIWVGTEDAGFNILDPISGKVRKRLISDSLHQSIHFIEHDGNDICIGYFQQGIDLFYSSGRIKYRINEFREQTDNDAYAFMERSNGEKWVSLSSGLYRGTSKENAYRIDEIGDDWVFDMHEARDGIVWIATMGSGIWKYDPAKNIYKNYAYIDNNANGLLSNCINSIMEDHKGRIWFSTDRGGICCYNKQSDNFTSYSISDGLPDDVTYDILEDDNNNLWFGTNKGLVCFNPESKKVQVYTTKDGLPGNQFNYQSALKGSDGSFYFGSIDGLIRFNPNQIEVDPGLPPLYITQFSIYNNEMSVHSPHTPLDKCIMHTHQITLPYNQTNLKFGVSLLNYSATKSSFCYRMYPIEKDWIIVDKNQPISYANLNPGKYTFCVQNTTDPSAKGYASQAISIVILPPWWKSIAAYILYGLSLLCILFGWFIWYRQRKEKELHERQKLFMIEKDKELYEAKVDFFTEIAHEIRTPLTLINTPLEAIQEVGVTDRRIQKYIEVIGQNTQRLLELTGQLLDFQKIEADKLTLRYECINVTSMLKSITHRFEPTIALMKKELLYNLPEHEIWAAVDKEGVTKILSNLLNNAMKYARHTIIVSLYSDASSFTVKVYSDGDKISGEDVSRIFDPFYQKNKKNNSTGGVGIGLCLSRSLALLHKGTLTLENNTEKEGNTFVLHLPINQSGIQLNNHLNVQKNIVVLEEESSVATNSSSYTVLFVEDNEDMRRFIGERLRETFTVETASNGEEALHILHNSHIDLIVTDIMMPVMDGYELCKAVKSDLDLSHIPIIFLTAKNDLNSKISGLKYGAEAYVEKPFSFNFLKEQIQSLLDNRRREREIFSKRPFFSVKNMQMNKADEEFMNHVIQVIEENITDDNFGVERMAEILCMSRSSLLRKIKTLFNLSPVDFIRLIKLKKAAELIQEGKHRIGDICYLVGINSPSYFSKVFLKQFGITPKEFEKQCQTGTKVILTTQESSLQPEKLS